MTAFQSFSKQVRFQELCEAVRHCTLCSRLRERKPVLSNANGDPRAKVLFIAEAPGRLGADVTGIPLSGDQTGENFETFLERIDWRRENVFMTNAVLCNPRDENGNNSTPTSVEIANCSSYLEMTLWLVEPEVVVTLGAVALAALGNIRPHRYILREHVGLLLPWNGRVLMPFYHPAPRARVHRTEEDQTSDFLRLARFADAKKGILPSGYGELRDRTGGQGQDFSSFQRLAYTLVESLGRMSYFRLTKLLYLADVSALNTLGRTLTGEIYLRQREGPWPPALRRMIEPLEGREIEFSYRGRTPTVEPGPSPRIEIDFGCKELEVIEQVLDRYGRLDNTGVKMAAYRTRPMRYVREQEKLGRNMLNKPVIYKDRALPELIV
jgi:uracil-DNA glycosylase family 4